MTDLASVAGEIRAALGRRIRPKHDVSKLALTPEQFNAFRLLQKEAFAFAADFLIVGMRREAVKDRFLDAALHFVTTFSRPTQRRRR